MIARYSMTYDDRINNRIDVELDEDGPWLRWNDVRVHVDGAISRLNQEDVVGAMAILRKMVDRQEAE